MLNPLVSIIILSWNVRDLLRACLRSLPIGDSRIEIIVVDSASTDGAPAMVQSEFPQVRLMASAENMGYTRGNNLGLRAARGRYLLILNPDTEISGDALAQMTAYMEAQPQVGVLGPQLLYPDGRIQSTRRRFPTFLTALVESTWLQPYVGRGLLDHFYARDLRDDEIAEVDWVMGAAMFVRRQAYEQVGGLDEQFFMYSEELDWCRRMSAAGWKVVYFPPARIIHHQARSAAQVPAQTHIRFNSSKVLYVRKYRGWMLAELLRCWLLGQFALQLILEAAKWLLGHKRELRAQRLSIYWQVLRSGLRPPRHAEDHGALSGG